MFFRCSKLNIRKAGICKKGLYATFSSWHIDPCRFPVKICFLEKECLKRQKIADLSFYFEFQVVVAVVGFKWHWRETVEKADLRSGNAFKSLPQRNALISLFNGLGSDFSILHRS